MAFMPTAKHNRPVIVNGLCIAADKRSADHSRMIKKHEFSLRLDAALTREGIDNKTFAAALGPNGQQLVNRWRARGRVGVKSLDKVRRILTRTNLDWLNSGVGVATRDDGVINNDQGMRTESQIDDVDTLILSRAELWVRAEEYAGLQYQPMTRARRILALCDVIRADGGELSPKHIFELVHAARIKGATHAGSGKGGTSTG